MEPPVSTTSCQRPVLQNTKSFQVKSLSDGTPCKRSPLVSDRGYFYSEKFEIFGFCFLPPVSDHLTNN